MSKTLPLKIDEAFKIVVKTVNYVSGSAFNYHTCMQLCKQMDLQLKVFQNYSEVCWQSRGKVTNRVFELRGATFLENQNHQHANKF